MKKIMTSMAQILSIFFVMSFALGFGGVNVAQAEKVYRIVADNSFAPFDFLDAKTNKYVGVDMDLLAAIAADQGFK